MKVPATAALTEAASTQAPPLVLARAGAAVGRIRTASCKRAPFRDAKLSGWRLAWRRYRSSRRASPVHVATGVTQFLATLISQPLAHSLLDWGKVWIIPENRLQPRVTDDKLAEHAIPRSFLKKGFDEVIADAGFRAVAIEHVGARTFPGYYREQQRPAFRRGELISGRRQPPDVAR